MSVLQWGRDVSIPEMQPGETFFICKYWLQWGRDVSIPEIRPVRDELYKRFVLQWGRDVSIPEIRAGRPFRRRRSASMGPGCFYPGNPGSTRRRWPKSSLQWGRDVSIPEIPGPTLRWPSPSRFNGAGMFLSRKCRSGASGRTEPARFNGAGMFLSRK